MRNHRIKRLSLWGGGLAAVVLLGLLIAHAIATAPPDHIAGVATYTNLARGHVTGTVTYPQNPPVGGSHNATLLTCGIYDRSVSNENAVHALEHGAVWITYRPDLPVGDVTTLRDLVRGHGHALLSPYLGLPAPVVASAWGLQLKVQNVRDPRLAQFLAKYENGPQDLEPGAPCIGEGNPIG